MYISIYISIYIHIIYTFFVKAVGFAATARFFYRKANPQQKAFERGSAETVMQAHRDAHFKGLGFRV